MTDEKFGDICITICVLAVVVLIGCWLYWVLIVQRQADVEIIKVMGAEAYLEMRKCLSVPSLCNR